MNRQTHVIRRQTLELSLGDRVEAPHLQAEVLAILNGSALDAMEAVFSRQVGQDEILRIGRLELDLGSIDPANLESKLCQRLEDRLDQALARASLHAHDSPTSWSQMESRGAQDESPVRDKVHRSDLAALLYFLRTGLLPWWRADPNFDFDASLLSQLEDEPAGLINALRAEPVERFVGRLLKQCRPTTFNRLLSTLLPSQLNGLPEQLTHLHEAYEHEIGATRAQEFMALRENLLRLSFRAADVSLDEFQQSIEGGLSRLLERDAGELDGALQPLQRLAGQVLPEQSLFAQVLQELGETVQAPAIAQAPAGRHPREVTRQSASIAEENADARTDEAQAAGQQRAPGQQEGEASADPPVARHRIPVPQDAGVVDAPYGDPRYQPQSMQPSQDLADELPELAEGIYIDNAGLVLLWPYLPRFFKQLGFLEDGDFPTADARERAVLLLQYLAGGETEFSENRLALNKLLCAWPLLQPVGAEIAVSQAEIEESQALLASVIEHWQVLKKTSPEGFCEAFLQREGRLAQDDLGWQLQINRSGIDVLLDSLPWGIGLIRLPWMAEALRVEW